MLLTEKWEGDIVHVMPRIEARLIERVRVDQTGYIKEFEQCARNHHWYQRCVQREHVIALHSFG